MTHIALLEPSRSQLLTTKEVAELLGLSPDAVLRRWRAGAIPGIRLASNVLRFEPDEIAAWLDSLKAGPRYPSSGGGGELEAR